MIANAGLRRIVFGEFYRDERIFNVAQDLGIELLIRDFDILGIRDLGQHEGTPQPGVGNGPQLVTDLFLGLADRGEIAGHLLAMLLVAGLVVEHALDFGLEHDGRVFDRCSLDELLEDGLVVAVVALIFFGGLNVVTNALAHHLDGFEALVHLLRELVVEDALASIQGIFERDQLAFVAGELFRDEARLRQETFQAACAVDRSTIFLGQLFDAEHRDDVLQVLVAGQCFANRLRDPVVPFAGDLRCCHLRAGPQRVDGGIEPFGRPLA